MKRGLLLVLVLVLALSVSSLAFQDEPDGFRGLKWGDLPGVDMDYFSTREFDINLYERLNDKMQIGDAELDDIYYLFYEGRFMAVEIKPNYGSYDALEDVVVFNFGDGEATKEYGLTMQILWVGDMTTMVLKRNFGEGWPILLIYSTEIWEEKEEEFSVKKQEAERKKEEERWEAAEEGLEDFSLPKEEQKEPGIEEQMRKIISLEKEKSELEQEIKQAEKRIKEITQELETLKMEGPEIEGPTGGRGVVRWVQPGFPRSADEQGIMDGEVRVKIWVLPSGEVVETMIIQTSGVPEFDQEASRALRKWIFGRIEGEEKQWGIVTFRFERN